jgi:hypothetical protein
MWEEDDQVWLDRRADLGVLGDGLDGVQGLLADSGILLVAKLLDESVNSPIESVVSYFCSEL